MPSATDAPAHRVIVLPFLRRPMARFVLADWTAITIWRWIFAWRPLTEPELAHELCHVRQWQANGLRFIPRYVAASRAAARAGGDRYRDNEFEREAAAAAAAVAAVTAVAEATPRPPPAPISAHESKSQPGPAKGIRLAAVCTA